MPNKSNLETKHFTDTEDALWLTAYVVVALPNFIGNTLVLLTVFHQKSLHTFTYYLLASLAVADLITGIFLSLESLLFTFLNGYSRGAILCKIIQGGLVTKLGAIVSILTLMVISLERYFSIVKPHKRQKMLKKENLKFIIPLLWIVAFLWSLPVNGQRYVAMVSDDEGCYIQKDSKEFIPLLAMKVMGYMSYLVPMSVMVFSFVMIWKVLWGQGSSGEMENSRKATLNARKKVVKILMLVLAAFNICILPHMIVGAGFLYGGKIHAFRFTYLLAASNSSINPIIYCYQSPQFRQSFKGWLCCTKISSFDNETLSNMTETHTLNHKKIFVNKVNAESSVQ